MTVASVTPLGSARGRKPRSAERAMTRARQRMSDAIANATTPGHVVAAGLDYLRIALSITHKSDPKTANAEAWRIHQELVAHADRLTARRTEDTDNAVLHSTPLQGRSN